MGTKNKNKIMKLYVYCDSTKINKEGNIPVMIIIKNNKGRFLVNTGLTTKEKFNGREFPKSDKNKTAKTNAMIDLPVEKEAMDIIDKYKGKDWLLSPMDGRVDYRSFERIWNDNLKKWTLGESKG